MEEERRKAVRIKKSLTAQYSKDKNFWDTTFIRDISEFGMQITTTGQLPTDAILTVRVKFPSKPFEWTEINGKVVGSTEMKTGFKESVASTHITRIQFVDLKEEHKKLIHEYIEWFLSKKGG